MTPAYLVDTDWAIDHLNRIEQITTKLKEVEPQGLAISVISLAELYEGVVYSRDPLQSQTALDAFVSGMFVLGIDEEICRIFGRERGRLRGVSRTMGDFDLMIAATCLRYNLTLLTNNRRHFEVVDGLQMVSV